MDAGARVHAGKSRGDEEEGDDPRLRRVRAVLHRDGLRGALLAGYTNSTTLAQGLWLGFLSWLGFAATIGLAANMFSEKPIAAWVIDAGYQFAYLLIMSLLLSLWR